VLLWDSPPLFQLHSLRLPVEGNIVFFTGHAIDVNYETVLIIVDGVSFFSKLIGEMAKNESE
jgi:hypothetical protein